MNGELRSERFRAQREDDWRLLENLLTKVERRSARGLTDDELLQIPVLYRSAMSALASARSTSLDAAVVRYLEALCARAYYFVYGVRSNALDRLGVYLARTLPAEVRSLWLATLLSAALLFGGALVAYLLVTADLDWFYAFIPDQLAQGRTPATPVEDLRQGLYGEGEGDDRSGLGAFASFLFTHNAQVALTAFALGFCLGLPTIFLIASNGLMLGAFMGLYAEKGLAMELGGWLSIHGVTELFAIILAGAAGLRIGWSAGFPGDRTRLDALMGSGRRGGIVMGGVVMMLMAAGILEGFGRQLITSDVARYSIAAATFVFWGVYFYWPRRSHGA